MVSGGLPPAGGAPAAGRARRTADSRRVRIDPQDLPQQRSEVLGVVELVVRAAAVARRHPQAAVRAEVELAAVVVADLRVLDRQHVPACRRIGDLGVSRGTRELVYPDVSAGVGVVDVHLPGRGVVGSGDDRQQPALSVQVNAGAHVEVRIRPYSVVDDQPDLAGALGDEQTRRVAGIGADRDRVRERARQVARRRASSGGVPAMSRTTLSSPRLTAYNRPAASSPKEASCGMGDRCCGRPDRRG